MKIFPMQTRFGKGLVLFFLIGFLGGIILIHLLGESYLHQAGILSDYFIRQYKYIEIDFMDLFFYILEKRLKWGLLLWVAGFTAAGVPLGSLYTGWLGFSAGTLLSISMLKMGLKGMLFSVGAVVPQIFLYVPIWIFLLYHIHQKAERRKNRGPGMTAKDLDWRYVLIGIGTVLFLFFGVFVESYINPWVLRQILRLF